MKTDDKKIKFVKKHRISFSGILIIVAISFIFLPELILRLPIVNIELVERDGIDLILSSSQIISSILVIIGTVIAVWQYYLSSSQLIKEIEFSRVEKAVELSNYYKDNILYRYSFVKAVFKDCGILETIEKKRKSLELKEFDVIELNNLYTKEEIKEFEDLPRNKSFVKSIIKLSSIYNIEIKGYTESVESCPESGEQVRKILVNNEEVIFDFFKTYITQTLNNAEYFAMSFAHNIADESVIYQSICPTYLEMCFMLYYYIAVNSDPSEFKLYTNIAELYCIWRKRQIEQTEEYQNNVRKNSKKSGTIFKN